MGLLYNIKDRILGEQAIQQSFNFTSNSKTSARRANFCHQSNPPNQQNNSTIYPPQNVSHTIIQQFVVDHPKVCIGCWQPDPGYYHLTHGCPVLAAKKWVVCYHRDTAQALLSKHREHQNEQQRGGRGRGRGQDGGSFLRGGRDGGRGGRDGGRGDNNANRVSEDTQAPAPAPSGEEAMDTGSQQSANCTSASRLAAGGENDGNTLDDRLVDDGDESNAPIQPLLMQYYTLSAGGNVVVSARHVPVSPAQEAKLALDSPEACVSFVDSSHEECCTDSEATEHMIPDYAAFTFYKLCKNEFVTLGTLHNYPSWAVEKPASCSMAKSWSQVNDSEDNIVSFKSIGWSQCKEPKTPTARPVHIIPVKNEMASVQFQSIVPKAGKQIPPPKSQPPKQSPSPTPTLNVIPDDELLKSAAKPLTKRVLGAIHDNISHLPEVPPEYTPAEAENTTEFDSLRVYCMFGCMEVKSQLHITAASKNATLICCGECPSTIGDYATINNPPKG
ncbi:hypothetical protein ACHAWO_010596 [Cyclotella atomus]|uniref:Uncharacterized protein n=1 Tax=Cyclotella atomus TaxID=382360 RepID=A0ABD3NHS8_9STRA